MSTELQLFKSNYKLNVRRFYHIDFYYYTLFAIAQGAKNEYDVFAFASKNRGELYEIGSNPASPEKFNSEYAINSVISELLNFRFLFQKEANSLIVTDAGKLLLELALDKKFQDAEIILCQKVEALYGRFSQLIKAFYSVNPKSGLILFPKPSPKKLNYTPKQLLDPKGLSDFSNDFAKYSIAEIKKYVGTETKMQVQDISRSILTGLTEYIAKHSGVSEGINFPREIKSIAYNYYLSVLFGKMYDSRSFDIWIKRAKEFKLLNFSEFYPGTYSLVMYPTAKVIPAKSVIADNFVEMARTKTNDVIIRFQPRWDEFKGNFMKALWENYVEFTKIDKNYWVSVQDLRDSVCFKLQLNEQLFASFLELAFRESMNERIGFKISLEVDRSVEERSFVNSKRFPIQVDGKPINIIGIKMI